jgi:hypothetical protein
MHGMFHRPVFADVRRFPFFKKPNIGQMRVGQHIGHSVIFHRRDVMLRQ